MLLVISRKISGKIPVKSTKNIFVTGDVVWMVRMACDLENNCVALERIFEYTKLQTEGSTFIYF